MTDKGATLDMFWFFGSPAKKKRFCTKLLRLLKLRSSVYPQNHSIPDQDVQKLFQTVKLLLEASKCDLTDHQQSVTFFTLSLGTMMEAKHPPEANPSRGYSFVGQENLANIRGYEKGLVPGNVRDMKVCLLESVCYQRRHLVGNT